VSYNAFALVDEPTDLRIDLGCGTQKKPGFLGVDIRSFEGVDVVLHAGRDPWPWSEGSVSEAHASHMVEHLSQPERCHFFNELYRVLRVGAKATIVTPHWASNRAYGDPTHVWPPVSEMFWYYLDAEWRRTQAPHTNDFLTCDFRGVVWGYSMNPALAGRNEQFMQMASSFYKEAVLDMTATLTR